MTKKSLQDSKQKVVLKDLPPPTSPTIPPPPTRKRNTLK